jgi:aryl-alcohol dehydrogenase-like predicted oxidoreductase
MRTACEGSLKRLDVDSIDVYNQVRIDSKVPNLSSEFVHQIIHANFQVALQHAVLIEVNLCGKLACL